MLNLLDVTVITINMYIFDITSWSLQHCVVLQVQTSSVLFVDNPVGTGFSYTDQPDLYATDVATVASDMLVLLKQFFAKNEDFQVS